MGASRILRFLVVDDEAEIRDLLVEQLRLLRFSFGGIDYQVEIEIASNGKEGLAKFEASQFDVILTDLNMPLMTGLEMLGAIRGNGNDVPAVILTGFGDRKKSAEALRLGAYSFLDKPWKGAYLQKVMQGAAEQGIETRSLNREIESRVAKYHGLPAQQLRQLRNVFRSMILSGDGLHRNDVSSIEKKKKSA